MWKKNQKSFDVVVIGSGAAGLYTALSLSPLSVLLITKSNELISGSTAYAQGGMAAVMDQEDKPSIHKVDTVYAGAGLVNEEAAEILCDTAPQTIKKLIDLGMSFDQDQGGALSLGREAAHSHRRILHAGGDATGRVLSETLSQAVLDAPHVQVATQAMVCELITNKEGVEGVQGVYMYHPKQGWQLIGCRDVVLATGGLGQIFSHTTNPSSATADGLFLAWSAGAILTDMEFVQFHPTSLDVEATAGRRPLLTEALRGEGAQLLNRDHERFMIDLHPEAELAPRDIVARAVWRERAQHGSALLDVRPLAQELQNTFPTVWNICRDHMLDPAIDLLPIAPAAHYHMGGVWTDLNGATSVCGLWAVGEDACTGEHGANRLASNSLTECLVFGHRLSMSLKSKSRPLPSSLRSPEIQLPPQKIYHPLRDHIQSLMYSEMGLIRSRDGMTKTLETLRALELDYFEGAHDAQEIGERLELQSLLCVAQIMTHQALQRTESRGGHYRQDYPRSDSNWTYRLLCQREERL